MDVDELERVCCIHGYHIYKEIWEAATGEVLTCEREPLNPKDRYTVAVKKGGTVVGHLPRKISRICSLFLRRGGTIDCIVIGGRKYTEDLPQGGLEVPCYLLLKAKPKEISKVKKLWPNKLMIKTQD